MRFCSGIRTDLKLGTGSNLAAKPQAATGKSPLPARITMAWRLQRNMTIGGGDKNVVVQARMPALRSAGSGTIFEGMPDPGEADLAMTNDAPGGCRT
jgi:hypothetical protein